MFKIMALAALIPVYLVLFTAAIPTKTTLQKVSYALFGLAFSAFLMFVAPNLYA